MRSDSVKLRSELNIIDSHNVPLFVVHLIWNLLCLKNMLLCQKSYLYKILSMLYDSNGLKSYIYVLFFKTCSCATQIYIILVLRQNSLNINFRTISEVFGTAETVFTGHVQPMAWTYPPSWICPAPSANMFGSRVSSLYKGVERPPQNPRPLFSLPLHLLRRPRAL
jgi:hypothetical protein